MNLVSAFSIVVFALAWWFYERTPGDERLVRLFFGTLMVLGASAGLLGLAARLLAG